MRGEECEGLKGIKSVDLRWPFLIFLLSQQVEGEGEGWGVEGNQKMSEEGGG